MSPEETCQGRQHRGRCFAEHHSGKAFGEVVWREFLEELREYKDTFNEIAQGTGLLEVQADA